MHAAVNTAMNVLGLDSATDACSAALLCDGRIAARRLETMRRGHAEVLLPLVRDVMAEAGFGFDCLDLVATTVGPGGFTGIRIGLASARALALAAGTPIVGVTTLEAVARAQPGHDMPLLVALDSKRADIYVQLFDSGGAPLSAPDARLPETIAALLPAGPIALAGSAAGAVAGTLADRKPSPCRLDGPTLPDAADVAQIGAARFAADPASADTPPRPLYLRPPDARLPSGT